MKKVEKILLGLIFTTLFFIGGSINVFADESSVQSESYDSLSEEAKQHFKNEGFGPENEYFTEVIEQTSPNRNSRAAVNVVLLTASTKKVTNTQGYTSYIITSKYAPFLKLNMNLNIGSVKKVTSNVVPAKGAYGYSGGIYSNYTGKSGYQRFTLQCQYVTTWGAGSASCSAGGLTIGK